MGEHTLIEQTRIIEQFFFIPAEENRIMEQQGTVNSRTFVLLNFRSIILAPTIIIINSNNIYIYIYIIISIYV